MSALGAELRILVVGLVDRPEFLRLREAAEARGHHLQGCYSTELVIESSEEGFIPRLRGRDIHSFDVILPWTLKFRKWDWFVAAQCLQEQGGPLWLQSRAIDPKQPPFISPAHHLSRVAEAGFEVQEASFASGTQIALELAQNIGYPILALPIGPGVRKRARRCRTPEELKDFIGTRSERALSLRACDDGQRLCRILVGAGRVLGCIELPDPVPPGEKPEQKRPIECPEGVEALALDIAKALGIAFGEIDVIVPGEGLPPRFWDMEEGFDRMALDVYNTLIYKDIIEHIEGMLGPDQGLRDGATQGIGLSACILSRDGASTLPRLLRQLRPIVDEIIVVAINPSEKEIRAANRRGDRLILWEDERDFGGAWNAAIQAAQGRHILWLRESDIFSGDDALKVKAAVDALPPEVEALDLPYSRLRDAFGRDRHRVMVPRIFRRDSGISFVFQRCVQLNGLPSKRPSLNIPLRYDPPAHRRTKERQEAKDILGPQIASEDIRPTPGLLGELGECLIRAKAYEDALPYLERSLEEGDTCPLRARVAVLLALAKLRLGDTQGCRRAANIAMVEEPRLGEAPRLIAESYLKDKDLESAREWLELAHRTPLDGSIEVIYPYWYDYGNAELLSRLWERLGSPRTALAYLDEVESVIPVTKGNQGRRARLEKALGQVWDAGGR